MGACLLAVGWPDAAVGVLDSQNLREDVKNRRVGRQRLEHRKQLRARLREDTGRFERRRPGRGTEEVTSQDATVDVPSRRRHRAALRVLTAIEAGGRCLLIGLLLPLAFLPALMRPREFLRRAKEAPTRLRSSARRIRISSRDPSTAAGRFAEASRLSLHFVREELSDMQDGFPSPSELAESVSARVRSGGEKLASLVGILPSDGRSNDLGDRVLHAAALGLIGGAVVVGIFVASFEGMEELKTSERMSLQHITVLGLGQLAEGELLMALDARSGDNLLELDLARVRDSATEHPWVERAEITRNLREQSLQVQVVEHRPALLLAGATLKLIDDRGRVFKRHAPTDPIDFPVLTIEGETSPSIRTQATRGAVEILHALAGGRVVTSHELSELRFAEGEGFTLFTRSGLPIRLGSRDFAVRLGRLERAVDTGKLPLEAVASVDISLRDRLVVVPQSTRRARRVLEEKVESQPVPAERRSRMLHLKRALQGLDSDQELTL